MLVEAFILGTVLPSQLQIAPAAPSRDSSVTVHAGPRLLPRQTYRSAYDATSFATSRPEHAGATAAVDGVGAWMAHFPEGEGTSSPTAGIGETVLAPDDKRQLHQLERR